MAQGPLRRWRPRTGRQEPGRPPPGGRGPDGLGDEATGAPPRGVGTRIDLERAFEHLSETSRAVIWLHDVEGFTHEEIAERMGRTVSFSKSQLARANARLRRLLSPAVESES